MATEQQSLTSNNLENSVIHSIFKKTHAEMTEQEVELAVNFLKELTFFADMRKFDLDMDSLMLNFLSAMKYTSFKQGKTIFNYRDKPSEFYIILKGNVDLHIPKTEAERKIDVEKVEEFLEKRIQLLQKKSFKRSKTQEKELGTIEKSEKDETERVEKEQLEQILLEHRLYRDSFNVENMRQNLKDYLQTYNAEITSKLKKLKTLGPSEYFGELALTMNCLRSAKAVASTDVCVVTLSRDDYKKILCQFESALSAKIEFFSKLLSASVEEGLSIAKFCYGFTERKYLYGQRIFKQGDIPQEIFIVKKGEVQISTQVSVERESSVEFNVTPKKKKAVITRNLAKFGAYTLLGGNEASAGTPYGTTVTSSSNDTVLYVVPIQEFRSLQANYKPLCEKLLNQHEKKQTYLKDRLQDLNSVEMPTREVRSRHVKTPSGSDTSRSLVRQDSFEVSRSFVRQDSADIPSAGLKDEKLKLSSILNSKVLQIKASTPKVSSFKCPALSPFSKNDSANTSKEFTPKHLTREKSAFGDFFKDSPKSAMNRTDSGNLDWSQCGNPRLSIFVRNIKDVRRKRPETKSIESHSTSQNSSFRIRRRSIGKVRVEKSRFGAEGESVLMNNEGNEMEKGGEKFMSSSTLSYLKQKYSILAMSKQSNRTPV